MKKINYLFLVLMIFIISSSSVLGAGAVIGASVGIDYSTADVPPMVFMKENGRAVFEDNYGFYSNGNIEERPNNYIFTGEKMEWYVLVWDTNGMPMGKDVFMGYVDQTNGPTDPEIRANCQRLDTPETGTSLAELGYPNVRMPHHQEPQTEFNSRTMALYRCTINIPPSCHGQKWFNVKALDMDTGASGVANSPESWFCNPELDLYVSGNINFGKLGPGEQRAATFSIKNTAEQGSGVQVVVAISGKNFYDPSPSPALCPNTNVLKLQGVEAPSDTVFETGFWYEANSGSASTPGPKRIPYGTSITKADPIFSNSNSAGGWRDWSGPYHPLNVGSEISVTMHLGLPQPCNGQFTSGKIQLWAWPI